MKKYKKHRLKRQPHKSNPIVGTLYSIDIGFTPILIDQKFMEPLMRNSDLTLGFIAGQPEKVLLDQSSHELQCPICGQLIYSFAHECFQRTMTQVF